jgi:hypothetical protein
MCPEQTRERGSGASKSQPHPKGNEFHRGAGARMMRRIIGACLHIFALALVHVHLTRSRAIRPPERPNPN